jgi:anti-sigma regulatory factor (Ser/Thr protein kinase)
MTQLATAGVRSHVGYRHEALMWRGKDEFLAGTVPFIAEGVATGQPVMVAVIGLRLEWLAQALGDATAKVTFVDMAEIGRNPARIIPAWRRFIEENGDGARAIRGIGEPLWAGRRPAEITECEVHESLLNLAIGPHTPLWLRCPYEDGALDEAVLAEARRSHPSLVERGDASDSGTYGGMAHIRAAFEIPLPAPAAQALELEFGAADLCLLRQLVASQGAGSGMPDRLVDDLVLAVHEVAANSVDHGGGGGRLRVWRDADALVCEIRDRGRIEDAMVGRRTPGVNQRRGRGLWLANQLCDLVQIRSVADGTIVRLSVWP